MSVQSVFAARAEAQESRARLSPCSLLLVGAASVVINLLWLVLALALYRLFDDILLQAGIEALLPMAVLGGIGVLILAVLSVLQVAVVDWQAARQKHAAEQAAFTVQLTATPDALHRPDAGRSIAHLSALAEAKRRGPTGWVAVAIDLCFAALFLWLVHRFAGWLVAIPAALGLAALALAIVRVVGERTSVDADAEGEVARQTSFIVETISQLSTIKALALEAPMMRRFERLIARGAPQGRSPARNRAMDAVLQKFLDRLVVFCVLLGGSYGLVAGTITPGALAACLVLAERALHLLGTALMAWQTEHRTARLLARAPEGEHAVPALAVTRATLRHRLRGEITLQDVTIQLAPKQPPVLSGFSMTVSAGATVGITGGAGTGKTALLMLIAGQHRARSGRVLLDGRYDPADLCHESLLQQVHYVAGNAPIYAGSLRDNITMFARTDAETSARDADRVYDLADRLGLSALASSLPRGFNTPIGPGSSYFLSDGLAQRIAIARAFYATPRIMLFDAANTALDAAGDAMIRRFLDEERGTCTMVIVSQRPSLLRLADEVHSLSDRHTPAQGAPKVDLGLKAGACA